METIVFASAKSAAPRYKFMAGLQQKYKKEIVPSLVRALNLPNVMAAPRLEKIVINAGIGRLVTANPQTKEKIIAEVTKILELATGQKPVAREARKAISGFKLRQGEIVGLKVTLRGRRMYDFLERLIGIALPRTRDFRGIALTSVDDQGNLTLGIREHIVFPETVSEETKQIYGFEITLVPRAKSRDQAIELYRALGLPFEKR